MKISVYVLSVHSTLIPLIGVMFSDFRSIMYKHRVNKVKKRTNTCTILSVYLNRGKYERKPNIYTIP